MLSIVLSLSLIAPKNPPVIFHRGTGRNVEQVIYAPTK